MSQVGILQEIAINKIRHPPKQLRLNLDHLEELAASISQHGLLQPIVVRPKDHEFEVAAGNRRLAAVKMLKLRKISCHIVELSDREAYEVALVENVQHKTMNPIEEGLAFSRYVKNYGWGGVSELARRIGRSQEFVTKRIQLLRLPERVRQEIIRQRITPTVALEMLPLDKEAMEEFADFILDNPLTKEEIRQIVKVSRIGQKDDGPEPSKSGSEMTYEKELYLLDKSLRKSIAVMKSTLVNFDDIVDNVHDEWVLKELLMQYRQIMHGDIDTFLKLRKRLRTKMPKEYHGSHEGAANKIQRSSDGKEPSAAHDGADDSLHMWITKGIWQ
jgi:ParB family chromosome partitioning protein